jgi:hypothetical protein
MRQKYNRSEKGNGEIGKREDRGKGGIGKMTSGQRSLQV